MSPEAAELLEAFSGGRLEVIESYGARGGTVTTAVRGDSHALLSALASFLTDAVEQGEEDCRDIAEALNGLREDQLGRDTVWY